MKEQEIISGTEVKFRDLRWQVIDIQPLGGQDLFRLRGLEEIILGKEIEILHPLEEIEPVIYNLDPEKASPLQNWLLYHQAFLLEQSLGDMAILSIQPGRLKLEPYQIVPLMRALKMSRPRLLLCDDVGLGKTIQAAYIIIELMARRLAHRVLIVSPAGPLLTQWKQELLERFGLRVEIIDRNKIEEVRRKSELGANPFDQIPLGLSSIDFLKQERILELLERTVYDIVVIDEAHHCADSGIQQDKEDTLRRDLAKVLAHRCDILLLLTATPHNGVDRSFASLLELLDISLVNGKGEVIQERYKPYVIRRLKKHIKDYFTNEPKFKERKIIPIPVIADQERHRNFIYFHQEFLNFIAPQLKSAFRNRRYGDVLAFMALLKRSVSSIYACVETLKVVRDRFDNFAREEVVSLDRHKERIKTLRDYIRKMEKFGVLSFEEEEDQKILQAEDIAEQLVFLQKKRAKETRGIKKVENIRKSLDNLIDLAEQSLQCDPKIEIIDKEIKKIRSQEPNANILIYTEYTDSQKVLWENLKSKDELGKILKLSGADSDKERQNITDQFCNEDKVILISTDASAEGLNLQQRCHYLIHLELPFNPNRLEQRNGRIDRYGQIFTPIIRYLFLKNTFEDRILLRLIAKYEKQRSSLGFVPDTLGISYSSDASCEKLLKGIIDEEGKLFKKDKNEIIFDFSHPEKEEITDAGIRELLEEIDKSFRGYRKALENNLWMGEYGINSEMELITEAANANEKGKNITLMDLKKFVLDTSLFEGGSVKDGEIFKITLPPSWDYGLEGLPGYNPQARKIKLTVNLEITKDSNGDSVGFLGRAHPLVRSSLDRIKNIGSTKKFIDYLDPRISAVRASVETPKILFTFLGLISTKKVKIFEKVFAIKIDRKGNKEDLLSPSEWSIFLDINKAINPAGIWENYFHEWADSWKEKSLDMAFNTFKPLAGEIILKKKKEIELQRKNIEQWFSRRVEEITGKSISGIQLDIFNISDSINIENWSRINDPFERLTKFCQDKNVLRSKRSEADTLLRVYKERIENIELLSSFKDSEVKPLGILMIIPEGVD